VVGNADRAIRRMRRSILFELVSFNRRVGGDTDASVLLATLRCFSETEETHVFSAAISELLQQGIVIGVPQTGGQLTVRLNLAKRAEINEELVARRERYTDGHWLVAMSDESLAKKVLAVVALIIFIVWSSPSARNTTPRCANNCATDLSANRR
jgi:hypothetical protein